ncbi:MAG: hypothetical protein MJA27_09435 [Pseudanabaenales cyanobacterium]|nr:hypothetical protein [Pseudanabaenales cyanobacterium]
MSHIQQSHNSKLPLPFYRGIMDGSLSGIILCSKVDVAWNSYNWKPPIAFTER